MSMHLNNSTTVCVWLMQSSYSYFIDLLCTFSREILSYLAFVKKHTQIRFWNCASNALKLVKKTYTDEVQKNWVEKSIHKTEENYFCLEIRRKKIPDANAENITVFELALRQIFVASHISGQILPLVIVIIILFHRTKRYISFSTRVIKRPYPMPMQTTRHSLNRNRLMKKTVKRKNIICYTLWYWKLDSNVCRHYPDVQKLNAYPVLSVFQRNPRNHYFCILKVTLVGSLRRNYVEHFYILVTIARGWDLRRLHLPPPSSYIFKAH